ncbi:MAG: glycosyltransferase family 4 protein [Planctomycetes bacterium]|nr:glycosyltransferase family 4 protein [Planctomycetota bacterium]
MRVLVANTHSEIVGGVESYLREALPLLIGRGHEIAFLTQRTIPDDRPTVLERCPNLTFWHTEGVERNALFDALSGWRPDVCYLHGLDDPDWDAALIERFPTLLYCHNHYGACISGTRRLGFPTARPCPRVLGPMCLAYYLPRRCGGLSPVTMFREYRLQRQRQHLLPQVAGIAVATRFMLDEYRQIGVPESRLQLLPLFPPGLQADPAAPTPRAFSNRVLLIGRLTELKGGHLFLRAIPRAQQLLDRTLSIVVAGDGPERSTLEILAKSLKIAVEFTGWIGSEERQRLMRSCDLLAVPSTWSEPFALVGIEAGCVGLPAVAFAVGGIPDWLITGESGEIAAGDLPTSTGLADAIARALRDQDHWQRLREGAWNVARRFTESGHLEQLESMLNAVAAVQSQSS